MTPQEEDRVQESTELLLGWGDDPLWETSPNGLTETCRACGAAHEGSAGSTLSHFDSCSAVDAYYKLKNVLGLNGGVQLSGPEAWREVTRSVACVLPRGARP